MIPNTLYISKAAFLRWAEKYVDQDDYFDLENISEYLCNTHPYFSAEPIELEKVIDDGENIVVELQYVG